MRERRKEDKMRGASENPAFSSSRCHGRIQVHPIEVTVRFACFTKFCVGQVACALQLTGMRKYEIRVYRYLHDGSHIALLFSEVVTSTIEPIVSLNDVL